ncbi:hypothetical protein BD560DRAFT_379945 [Blakeslea trispora]|nr:hypothetical protein BD560DRAFT_379945 [Blakeslea trispora]
MIAQGILKLDKVTSLYMENAFGKNVISNFAKTKKQELYGRPAELPAALNAALECFGDDSDQKSLKKKLMKMVLDEEDGPSQRVLDVLIALAQQMTVKKKEMNEMRLQSGAINSLCNLFKASDFHEPQGYNKVLFPGCPAVEKCRPEVDDQKPYVNLVGEIKGESSEKEGVSLDTCRLGAFGLHMLWEYNLKHSFVFQAKER